MLQVKIFTFNQLQEKCSVAWDESGECVVTDPGFADSDEKDRLYQFIKEQGLTPIKILLTHGHFDHTFGLEQFHKDWTVPVLMHPADKEILRNNGYFRDLFGLPIADVNLATQDIAEGDIIRVGNSEFEVIHTPGHTPGGVCYLSRTDKLMFSGDTLFAGSIGRTDGPQGDYDALIEGIMTKLMTLDGDIVVIPGHGPRTSIADERTKNPFLQPFNLPYEDNGE